MYTADMTSAELVKTINMMEERIRKQDKTIKELDTQLLEARKNEEELREELYRIKAGPGRTVKFRYASVIYNGEVHEVKTDAPEFSRMLYDSQKRQMANELARMLLDNPEFMTVEKEGTKKTRVVMTCEFVRQGTNG